MKLIFATHNPNKLSELKEILSDSKQEIISLNELGYTSEIEETGSTLEENALIKARTIYKQYKENVFSEDTGLEIEFLNNEPGVYTARYAGKEKDANKNMDKLLQKLELSSNRNAQFRTVVALIYKGKEYLIEAVCSGSIAFEKSGEGGFGYDPIFIPTGYEQSFAQLSSEIKNTISHRAKALQKLKEKIADIESSKN